MQYKRMKRRDWITGVVAFCGAALGFEVEEPSSIFDGTTLRGWSVQNGPESAFYVKDQAIVIHEGSGFPTWLRYDKQLTNFDFRCEVYIQGWANGGIYFHAPEFGRPTETGFKLNIFQKQETVPLAESMGSIFPLVAPRVVNVRNKGEWNPIRILLQWPSLKVWINGELVHDIDIDATPALRHKFRSGYLGLESLSYPLRFRDIRLRPLPAKEEWTTLYESPADLKLWQVVDGKATWEPLGRVLRADGIGYLATREHYQDFDFQCYIRGSYHHNGGIIFRGNSTDTTKHYEIQLHDVEGAVYPTGSLYHYKRATWSRIEPEQWYPFQLYVKGSDCVVRINGDTVVEFSGLKQGAPAPLMLQAHANAKWIEYRSIRVRRL